MKSVLRCTLAFGLLLLPAAGLVGAHAREYVSSEYRGAVFVAFQFSNTCIDDQFTAAGQGGTVGGLLNSLGGVADPLSPDLNGSCWRKNHILPNANGDVSLSIMDQVETNVGGCLTQDVNGNGVGCGDTQDTTVRFCNSITVNVNDPLPTTWRFQDSQGVPSRVTMVTVTRLIDGSAIISPLLGGRTDCGVGVDAFGTGGAVGHS